MNGRELCTHRPSWLFMIPTVHLFGCIRYTSRAPAVTMYIVGLMISIYTIMFLIVMWLDRLRLWSYPHCYPINRRRGGTLQEVEDGGQTGQTEVAHPLAHKNGPERDYVMAIQNGIRTSVSQSSHTAVARSQNPADPARTRA